MIQTIMSEYGFRQDAINIESFGSGLINNTWKVDFDGKAFILQRINEAVFKNPEDIACNIRLMQDYLREHHPQYLFVAPLQSLSGKEMIFREGEGYFRLFPFVPGSHTKEVAVTAEDAFEAALQFGRFTRLLSGITIDKFRVTIPGFHDLSFRYRQFNYALQHGNRERIAESLELVRTVSGNANIVSVYEKIKTDTVFRLRATHHDTKISNVLFNADGKGLCVIDLDTVMPGYFISDVGDMIRTYLSSVSEEERDLDKIEVREDFYKAIVEGYQSEMNDELSQREKQHLFYAGQFMIYMQVLRFLTDYINNDVYYGKKYPGHNLVRAKNQLTLLKRLQEKEILLKRIISI